MKITLFLLLLVIFQVYSGNCYSQNARVSIQNARLRVGQVLEQIESQTEYLFVYNKQNVDVRRTVDINASNQTVSEVLDQMFKGTDIKYVMEGKNIVLTKNSRSAEDKTNTLQEMAIVRGKVTDSKGEPIIGANILEKGTANGVITNTEGEFSMNIPPYATIVVSYISYEPQTIALNGRNNLHIRMEEKSLALEQVVVTAMGLIKNAGEDKYAVLSDILGDEDHLGDMDFKVTGTKDGITATQMDIKVDGLSYEILEKALLQAKEGREYILGKITECIAEPREDLKPHAPRIETMTIPKEFIGAIIGPGGKIIQGMQEETGATITIEEVDNIGRIEIAGTNKKSIDDAMRIIKGIVAVPEVGEVYKGKVRSIMPYGAFVEFLPGKDGLLHISEIDWKRLETVEEAGIKEGDEIDVKLLDIDPKTGKFKLSRKVLLPRPERQERPEKK
jgi:predicted RNA-binding protein with RPS1 domain